MELSAGSGSGSFRAAFLAERLCFANLTLSFLEVLILACRSNKEPSEYTVYLGWPMKQRTVSAHCRSPSEFWMVATLSVSSHTCAGCGTAISCAGPLLSLLRPIARLSEIQGHGAALWRRLPRRPENAAWDRYSGGPRYRPMLPDRIESHGAARWRGPPRRPEKAAWDRYSGVEIPARAARPQLWAWEQLMKNLSSGM